MNNIDAALVFKSLGDANRLQIIKLLGGGEECACNLLTHLNITQPTLSYHMNILVSSGLVQVRRDSKWCYYTIDCQALAALKNFVASLTCTPDAAACNCD